PAGVTFNAASGTLGGTPAAGSLGTYTLHFTAHNGINPDATQTFTLTVQPVLPTITAVQIGPVVAGLPNQRSRIDRVVVSFSESLTGHPEEAFTLVRNGNQSVP